MKKLLALVFCCLWLTGCATISHKNVEADWDGFGATVKYRSTVSINPDDIPAFIRAVDKLEKLLEVK